METFSSPSLCKALEFGSLLLRPEASLTADERASLEFFEAFDAVFIDGVKPTDEPERWAAMSIQVGRLAYLLGQLPEAPDEGVTAAHLAWIEQQQSATDLNPFQRARLQDIVGWPYEYVHVPK
ncbi:hypothetical protein J2Y46_000937 [Microbacterium sp. BE35]|uniref:hypothetical protein n=1 Tax=Microbacterium sp. BE35 TaxID=2817773 RepID=UPI002867680D|nr:hypothetical protein [Microbacterium sp. BE35]MDR7188121.1 hypothetical protein [Microbacterium sp. BE35]